MLFEEVEVGLIVVNTIGYWLTLPRKVDCSVGALGGNGRDRRDVC